MGGKITKPPVCFCLPKETYRILLSSVTTIIFTTVEYINKKETAGAATVVQLAQTAVVEVGV
jgi:hypothetical protein